MGGCEVHGQARIVGFYWRVLWFNNMAQESVAKVTSIYIDMDPIHLYLMQQPQYLAFP